MFSVEYFNKAVIITAYNIRRINFRYQANLKRLIIQAMKRPCDKVILNFMGVRHIDNCALMMLDQIRQVGIHAGIRLCLLNLDGELIANLNGQSTDLSACISDPAELREYLEVKVN